MTVDKFPKSHADFLSDLSRRAPYYVPEWRCDFSSPDPGAALAFLWADMFYGTMERYRLLPENYRRILLDAIGSDAIPPLPAQSYLAFTPRTDVTQPIVVPAKTGAASPESPESVLETDRDLPLSPAIISALYAVFPSRDIVRGVDRQDAGTLFGKHCAGPHIWTFKHAYAFDISSGASLRLAVRLRGGLLSILCENAIWEFLDGECWKPLTVRENDGMLLIVFPEHKETPCQEIRFSLHRDGLEEAELCPVYAYPCGYSLAADVIYAEDTQQTEDKFFPFGQRFLPGLCFYIACGNALGKYGAEIELSFELSFEDFPIEGYPEPYVHLKKLIKASELTPPPEYSITVADVAWEYYNGVGWASLRTTDSSANRLFGDVHARTCAIHFICPPDIQPAVFGAHDALFIRARILSVDNLFKMHGNYKAPIITKPRFRYQYAGGVPVTQAEITEHLDTRKEALTSHVKLFGTLPLPDAVYFAFEQPFDQGTLLFVIARSGQRVHLRWEYAADTWRPLDIHDGTGGFTKTGIIAYQTAEPCKKQRLFGQEAYWMRLADTDGTFSHSANPGISILSIHENVVTATARIPGESSNLPAGAFTSLTAPVEGVSGVMNPLPATGGTPEETEEQIIQRLTSSFFHQNRAVAHSDYEQLAKEASPRVCKAKCYPNTNMDGAYAYGHACLVLLAGNAAQDGFDELSLKVRQYLDLRRPPGSGILHIIEPVNIQVGITVFADVARPDEALTVKLSVKNALARFLDPVYGSPDETGWEIGELPSVEKIFSFLYTIPGILRLTRISAEYSNRGIPMDYRRAAGKPFAVPASGTHKIILKSEENLNAAKKTSG